MINIINLIEKNTEELEKELIEKYQEALIIQSIITQKKQQEYKK